MKVNFVDKTILQATDFAKRVYFGEHFANKPYFLQKFPIEFKLLSLIILLVSLSLLHSPFVLGAVYIVLLLLALVSRVDIRIFISFILPIVGFFAIIVYLPGALSLIVKGVPVFCVSKSICLTDNGLHTAFSNTLRTLDSITLVVLFNMTTKWSSLIGGLKSIGVPLVIVDIINLSYRYIFIFMTNLMESHYSLKSRLIEKPGLVQACSAIASQVAVIFRKSAVMTEESYNAMLSRGYGVFNSDV